MSGGSSSTDPYNEKAKPREKKPIHVAKFENGTFYFYSCDRLGCDTNFMKPSKKRCRQPNGYCSKGCANKANSQRAKAYSHSAEARKKMSDASKKDWQNPDYRKRQQDADQRPDVRRKRSKARLGANNPRWKGGRRSEAEAFRRTKAWKVQSNRVQKRDNDTCQSCGRKRGEVKGMGGHHVYPLQDYINDGQDPYEYPDPLVETLCNQCHPSSDAREGLMKCPRPPPGIEPRQGYPRSKLHL